MLERWTLPRYVERGGTQDLRGPFQLRDVALDAFFFGADLGALARLIDRDLNRTLRDADCRRPLKRALCTYRVVPIAPVVMLVAAQSRRIELPGGRGWMPEVDVAFWVPVLLVRRVAGIYLPARIAFYQPYLFVDSGQAMATGRETYGYHKMLGQFVLPTDPAHVPELTVDSIAFASFGPTVEGKLQRVFQLRETGGAPPSPSLYTDAGAALTAIVSAITGGGSSLHVDAIDLAIDVLGLLDLASISQLFLKQFRAIQAPGRAAYRAITETRSPLRGFHGGGPLAGTYELELSDLASLPIRRELGLANGVLTPFAQFWSVIDFDLKDGDVLGRA